MTWPTVLYVAGVADLSSDRVRVWIAVTVSVSVFELIPFACAWATLVTEPEFRSDWVMVYVAVQVSEAPGARPPAGQVTVALSSVTVTGPARFTFPVFVTT